MKVKDLIDVLQKLPQNHEVITDLHSEYAAVTGAYLFEGYENNGYISRPYDTRGNLRLHGYVYVGVRDEISPIAVYQAPDPAKMERM